MNKTFSLIILVLIIIGAGWYYYGQTNKPIPATGEVVKIGVIAPLSGPLAEYGDALRNGITLAQEDRNNPNVEYIFEDSAYDPKKAVSAFYKLRDVNKVNIIANWGDPTSQALAPLMQDTNVPFIAFTSFGPVTQTSEYTIRPWVRPEDMSQKMWGYLRSKGLKKIAIIKLENLYLNSLVEAMIKTKNPDESVIVLDTYLSFNDKDFRTSINKLKNSSGDYDAVGVYLITGQIGQFYNQAKTLGLNMPTFGTDFFENQSDIDAAGSSIDGAVYANYDVTNSFRNKYSKRFGNVSQISYAGNGYDVAMMLNEIDLSDKDTIINGFKGINNFSGVLGEYNFTSIEGDRYLNSPVHVKEIRNGEIKAIY